MGDGSLMGAVRRPPDFVADLREAGERIRQQELESAVRQFVRVGELAADTVGADQVIVGGPNGVVIGGAGQPPLAPASVARITLQDGIVNAEKVEARTLSGDRLVINTVGSLEVMDGAMGNVEIGNGAITAPKMNVAQLSAIAADMGTLTAGLISGGTVQSGSGTPRTVLGPAGLDMIGSPGSTSHNGPSALTWYNDTAEAAAAWCFIGGSDERKTELVTLRGGSTDGANTCGIVVKDADASTTLGFLRVNAAGVINGSSGTIVVSDAIAKQEIRQVGSALETVRKLKPRRYKRKSTGRAEAGFVAQELREVIPDAVVEMSTEPGAEDQEPMLGIDYNQVGPYLARAVQELADNLDVLSERLAKLETGVVDA